MRDLLVFIILVVLSAPLALLPYPMAVRAGEYTGLLFYFLMGRKRRAIALGNVRGAMERGVLPEGVNPPGIVRENLRNMGRFGVEVIRVYYGLDEKRLRAVEVEGLEHLERARAKGKGVILITGHCGNWELLPVTVPPRLGRVCVVVRELRNPYVDRLMVRARERFGSEMVYKKGALRRFLTVLREGGQVAVVVDQVMRSPDGVLIDFLGAPAWVTKMPATLAKRTSAAVVPIFIKRTRDGHTIDIHPELELSDDETADARKMLASVEGYIRENPSQWLEWLRRQKPAPPARAA